MDTSTQITNVNKQLKVQAYYVDSKPEFDSQLLAEMLARHLPVPAVRHDPRATPASADASKVAHPMQEEANYRGSPPRRLTVADGKHDPKFVRFIDGANPTARKALMDKRMDEAIAGGGTKLCVDCLKSTVSILVNTVAVAVTAKPATCDTQRTVVGIDGVDQYQGSPSRIAYQIQKLIDVGVAVVCTIDSRYHDWLLLAYYLRLFGLLVIRERVVVADVTLYLRGHRSSARGDFRSRFLATDMPSFAGYVPQLRQVDRVSPRANSDQVAMPTLSPRKSLSARAARLASAERERKSYARAYQNSFAVGRLLREQGRYQIAGRRW
jgi:hypothetical protein